MTDMQRVMVRSRRSFGRGCAGLSALLLVGCAATPPAPDGPPHDAPPLPPPVTIALKERVSLGDRVPPRSNGNLGRY